MLTKKIERGSQLLESEKARTAALEASVSDCISEEQYYEMCRRHSLVWKVASNYRSIAELGALEARSCQELLLKTRDAGDSNQNIASGLPAMVQNERDRLTCGNKSSPSGMRLKLQGRVRALRLPRRPPC